MTLSLPLKDYFIQYREWVRLNPARASDLETTFKWVSYVLAGRINNSVVSTELVYAASNLLVFLNDRLIKSSTASGSGAGEKLRIWLTVLEYSEVFIELSAKHTWGERGRWILVGLIQMLKCAVRLVLLLKYKEKLVSTPAIPPMKRFHQAEPEVSSVSFTLKRSGRVIRKVEAAPPNGIRIWKPPMAGYSISDDQDEENDSWQLRRMLAAELLYIFRPITHLTTSYRYGTKSWKPWLLSLAMDVSSLCLLKSKQGPRTEQENVEVSRRTLLLVLYLLRSPFYERHSADRVNSFLDTLGRVLPLARFIAGPVKAYIPIWQNTYSYVWST